MAGIEHFQSTIGFLKEMYANAREETKTHLELSAEREKSLNERIEEKDAIIATQAKELERQAAKLQNLMILHVQHCKILMKQGILLGVDSFIEEAEDGEGDSYASGDTYSSASGESNPETSSSHEFPSSPPINCELDEGGTTTIKLAQLAKGTSSYQLPMSPPDPNAPRKAVGSRRGIGPSKYMFDHGYPQQGATKTGKTLVKRLAKAQREAK
ncbi:hypothetical protein L873DRAFT_1848329 [Choiromyces venosus 120613-1]|uniref:Uncharacterized protein n=1 Tax=Choiromyces venosus 120613-1 TaxID=1336337 RepID=A0A3N4J413_9PEZI|nr:hypothetical protein L873DRAFT_1848329 [Choiromyces venosus 120613-1]